MGCLEVNPSFGAKRVYNPLIEGLAVESAAMKS